MRRAKCYSKLSEMCRLIDPASLVDVERQWGDALFAQHQYEAAADRYVQAGDSKRAVESSILANNLTQASDLLQSLV